MVIKRGSEWDYPTMRNISEGGCFLETTNLGGISEMVHLNILLPLPLPVSVIKAQGEVRWVSDSESHSGMGIQFKELSSKDLTAIKEFLRRGL
jgi:Tfp pilus assembly protein PilZ